MNEFNKGCVDLLHHYIEIFPQIQSRKFKASSKNLALYKWFLLNQAFWNLSLDLLLFSWEFTPALPAVCFYSSSRLFRSIARPISALFYNLLILCIIGKALGVWAAFVHRYIHAVSRTDHLLSIYYRFTPWCQILNYLCIEFIVLVRFCNKRNRISRIND